LGQPVAAGMRAHKGVFWTSCGGYRPLYNGIAEKKAKKQKFGKPRGMPGFKMFFEIFKNQAITANEPLTPGGVYHVFGEYS